jgi:hypothetical protein
MPNHRATYITGTLKDARRRAWENDTRSGFVDVIRLLGKQRKGLGVEAYVLAGITIRVLRQDLKLEFSNGSQIDLFGADKEGMAEGLRGIAKNVFWIDEAQDLSGLDYFYRGVIVPSMSDFVGECWMTGTPGRDCVGMFYEVTADDEPPLTGWEVHRIAAVDNPFFGRVVRDGDEWVVMDNIDVRWAPYRPSPSWTEEEALAAALEVRWDRAAGAAIRENGWAEDDPDLLREYYARWVKQDARFVYALHSVPEHKIATLPQRLGVDGFPDLRLALTDLPGWAEERQYFTICGADLGTRAAFAFCVWAWSLMDSILYEVASWKMAGLDYDEMATHLHSVRGQIGLSMITADAGGGGKPAVMGWSRKWMERYSLPITEATKQNKAMAQKQMNNDIRKGFIVLRKDSPLMLEWKAHRWKKLRTEDGREVEDGTPHDVSDAALYGHRESFHHRFREPVPQVVPGSTEWVLKEEQEILNAAIYEDYG